MRLILDCFGGDNCPDSAVDGALLALEQDKNIHIALCGDESAINACLAGKEYDKSRIEVLDAQEVITNEDSPVLAIRRKKNSSMTVGLRALAEGDYDAMVSSGNTGALLVGASIIVKLIDGVQRASLSPLLPTLIDGRSTLLVDGGANVDCKAGMLKEFAVMGSTFMSSVCAVSNPRVALLNNGTEEEKGNALTKEAYQLLKNTDINFVGNIEARELFSGFADVIVSDGFAGNVSIKAAEGMGNSIFALLKRYITEGGARAKLGYLLLKPSLKRLKNIMSGEAVGGGVFLGVKKVVVKAHGASNDVAFKNAIMRAKEMAEAKLTEKIAAAIAEKADKEN